MEFTCTIDMDNAAFEDPCELSDLLRMIAIQIECSETDGICRDNNGNIVGKWEITGENN